MLTTASTSFTVMPYRDNIQYFSAIILALAINFYFAYVLKIALKTKVGLISYVVTFLFYLAVIFMPVFIVPAFGTIMYEMIVPLPLMMQSVLMLGMSPYAIFIYIISFSAFSPLVISQLSEAIPDKKIIIFLKVIGYIYFIGIIGYIFAALFRPIF